VIDSAVVMAEKDEIRVEDLGIRDAGTDELESLRIEFWEKKLIHEALKRTGGNMPDASKMLGISRATLYRKLDEYQIQKPE
jgi:transcriptional regulator of acetoin/glycerol metabolism